MAALNAHDIGLMCQPGSNHPRAGWLWAADNGCFSAPWDEDRWARWLDSDLPRSGCLFATVPDEAGDHDSTLQLWHDHAATVRSFRYPLAFVAQDGATIRNVPWDELDTLFIGGTTAWKLGAEVTELIGMAKQLGKWVHIGRVNSRRRFLAFAGAGADSADGTFLAFGPDTNLPLLLGWVDQQRKQLPLFTGGAS